MSSSRPTTRPYQQTLVPLLEITDTLLTRGAGRQIGDDIELTRMQTANRNRAVWTDRLRAHADEDPLTAYLWLAFNCTLRPGRAAERHGVVESAARVARDRAPQVQGGDMRHTQRRGDRCACWRPTAGFSSSITFWD